MSMDYGGIEVKAAQWYHQDKTMFSYIEDPTKDMHKDTAGEIFLLPNEEISKDTRFVAKNDFVFAQFYGDYYRNNAKSLWSDIDKMHLKTKQTEIPLKKHLRSNGISNYEKFVDHIKDIESSFWDVRFKEYKRWKEEWVKAFRKNGYFCSLSGFTYTGLMGKNQIINYPVQGVAFHSLLWSLIQINKWMKMKGMKSLIVGQIHDEIIFDVDPQEKDDLIALAFIVMTKKIKQHWPWISTHLAVDVEAGKVDESWDKLKLIQELRGE